MAESELKELAKGYLWTEQYRPQTIDDCILPNSIKNLFRQQRDTGIVTNMLLTGSHGTGKCLGYNTKIDVIVSDELFAKIIEGGFEYE